MPRKLPPHCERWRDRHGEMRIYFRRDKGPHVALPPDSSSPEFDAAYKAALIGVTPTKPQRGLSAAPGTIAALIHSYRHSPAYAALRPTSRKGYDARLKAIDAQHGHRTVSGLTCERINALIMQPYAGKPGAALDTIKKLRVLIRHAIDIGLLKDDPSLGIKRPKGGEIRS